MVNTSDAPRVADALQPNTCRFNRSIHGIASRSTRLTKDFCRTYRCSTTGHETILGTIAQRLGRMRWTWMATNKSATYSDDDLSCWKTQRLKMSLPSNGRRTLASPSTHTFGASGRILPQLIASRRRAPDRLPSCSGAVVTYTAASSPPRY